MQRFRIQNFGCRASQADGAALRSALEANGFVSVDDPASTDWIVLNTCTVTATADDEVRQAIRRAKRANPGSRVLVTGCYAQRAPQELASFSGVDMVVGNTHKTGIPELMASRQPSGRLPEPGGTMVQPSGTLVQIEPPASTYHAQIHVGDIFAQSSFLSSPVEEATGDRSRPNLKIQDGCNNRCSFCIIPYVRGHSRSMPATQVVDQIRVLARSYPEVVLSGINLGRWGRESGFVHDREPVRIAGLVKRILAETDVQRLRLSSIEPMDLSDELLDLIASSNRIARHVHAPLQSGSDSVLRRMHRKYRPRHYEDRIREAHRLMPDAAFGADVMTGFPGETDTEFADNVAFIKSLPYTYLHVFTYSERPGTPAAERWTPVPVPVRKERNRVLRELAERKNAAFRQRLAGKTISAVTLDGGAGGLSSNFVRITFETPVEPRRVVDVHIEGITSDQVVGRVVSKE